MFTPSLNPKELTINLLTMTDLNSLNQEPERHLRESRGHPGGFLVLMLVL